MADVNKNGMRGAAMPVPAGSLRGLTRTWCCLMMLLVMHCDTAGAQCPALPNCTMMYSIMVAGVKKVCGGDLPLPEALPMIKMMAEAATTMATTTMAPSTGGDSGSGMSSGVPGPKKVTTKKPEMTDAPALATRTAALSKTAMATALMVAGSLTGTRGPALILTGLSLAYTVSSNGDAAADGGGTTSGGDAAAAQGTNTHLVAMYINCEPYETNVRYFYIGEGVFTADNMFKNNLDKLAFTKLEDEAKGKKFVVEIFMISKTVTHTYPSPIPTAGAAVARETFGLTAKPETLNYMILV